MVIKHGKSSTRANKYNAKAYDRLNIVIPKGEKEKIRDFAESNGETVNGFINRLIKEAMSESRQKEDSI